MKYKHLLYILIIAAEVFLYTNMEYGSKLETLENVYSVIFTTLNLFGGAWIFAHIIVNWDENILDSLK